MTSKITRQAKKQENMTHNENNNLLVFFQWLNYIYNYNYCNCSPCFKKLETKKI